MNNQDYNTFLKERTLIGQGRMAKVYLWRDYAYKEFNQGYNEKFIDYEIAIQNEVCKTKLPVPKYYPSAFSLTIKMDYLSGITLADKMRKEKYKEGVEYLVNLYDEVHLYRNLNLPLLKPHLIKRISELDYNDDYKKIALSYIEEIPDDDRLCHLDFHFLNIMISNDKPFIIDWTCAKLGNPIYDFARTYVIIYEFAYRLNTKFLKLIKDKYHIDQNLLDKAIYVMTLYRLSEFKTDKIYLLAKKYEEKKEDE